MPRALRTVPLLAIAAAALNAQTPGTAAGNVSPLSSGAVAGQISTGFLGTAVGFFGGGLATRWGARRRGANVETASHAAYLGAYAGATLATAVGPAAIGSRGNAHGSYAAAVGGAAAGGIVSALIKRLGQRGAVGEHGPVAIVAGLAIVLMPSVGATVAYNASR
jgi:hypothetical protein